jgi:hypothetical protein
MTQGLSRSDAAKRIEISGEVAFGEPLRGTLAVMA